MSCPVFNGCRLGCKLLDYEFAPMSFTIMRVKVEK